MNEKKVLHNTTLRLKKNLVECLKKQAGLENRSMTSLISELCELGLQAREQGNERRIEEFRRVIRMAGRVN